MSSSSPSEEVERRVHYELSEAAATGSPAKEVQTALNLIAAVVHAIYTWEVGYVQMLQQQQQQQDPLPMLRRVWPRAMATVTDRPMATATAVASTVEMALQEVLLPLLPPEVMDDMAAVNPSAAALMAQRELGLKRRLLVAAMRIVLSLDMGPAGSSSSSHHLPFITSMLLPLLGRLRLYRADDGGGEEDEVDAFSRAVAALIGSAALNETHRKILMEKHGYRNQGRFDDDADLRQEAPESDETRWWRQQRTEAQPTLPNGSDLLLLK